MLQKLIYLTVFLCGLCLLPFAEKKEQPGIYHEYYNEAARIFDSRETTEAEDRRALQLFEKVIGLLTTREKNDSLLFESYTKSGSLLIGLDAIPKAVGYFNAAIATGLAANINRSNFFLPHLYCGRSWFAIGQHDSALYHYKIAEKISDAFPKKTYDRERLFNMLGAVYYDLGNYKQAVNYFEKAVEVLPPGNPDYIDLVTRYKNNISACLVRLNEFDKANSICDELLRLVKNKNQPVEKVIWHRKANISLNLGAAEEALHFLNKVSGYPDRGDQVKLLNDYAAVYYNLEKNDSALAYLQRSLALNKKYFPSEKNPDRAIACKIWGDVLESQQDIPGALHQYHLAIQTLVSQFTDTSIYNNPNSFGGVFAANILFETLVAKAVLFEKWYALNNDISNLQAAVNTYESVFKLTGYMQQSYDTDEARLLLNKKKYAIHDNPIRLCIQLYRATGNKKMLEKAFYFDELNKASVLNENLALLETKKNSGIPVALLDEEKSLKQKVTALLLKTAQTNNETVLMQLQNQVRDNEIRLNKIYEQLATYPAYEKTQQESAINPADIQGNLDKQSMVLAYHMANNEITCFWFKKKEWGYFVSPVNDSFFNALEQHVTACRSPEAGNSITNAVFIYQKLMQPATAALAGINNLVIIPDDELHQLPFESLVAKGDRPLGTLYSFSYNYSGKLLFRKQKQDKRLQHTTLALAPFAGDSTARFSRLRFSGSEIAQLDGKLLLNRQATKENFLQLLPHYRVLHFATHASAGNDSAHQSYIAFNNTGTDSSAAYLYSDEITNLDMDSVQLAYLSACETGYGQLVRGEGMMSLSRAFAYAGCPDIITSLWQADDAATSEITKQFYLYYYKGYPVAKALQQAKIDYLDNPAIDKRKKTPFYWAHLVFVGQQAPTKERRRNLLPVIGITFILLILLPRFIKKRKAVTVQK
jgi:CHAT domain-containing protein